MRPQKFPTTLVSLKQREKEREAEIERLRAALEDAKDKGDAEAQAAAQKDKARDRDKHFRREQCSATNKFSINPPQEIANKYAGSTTFTLLATMKILFSELRFTRFVILSTVDPLRESGGASRCGGQKCVAT